MAPSAIRRWRSRSARAEMALREAPGRSGRPDKVGPRSRTRPWLRSPGMICCSQAAPKMAALGRTIMKHLATALSAILVSISSAAFAADYPAPKQGEWIAKDFKFHTGEVMPQLKLHYTTVGDPSGQPVLVLHGTGGSAASMLTPGF